jgi:cytidylate kinase
MVKTDKKRSSYYNYYSNKKWGDVRSYDLCINRSPIGVDGAVDMILKYIDVRVQGKSGR